MVRVLIVLLCGAFLTAPAPARAVESRPATPTIEPIPAVEWDGARKSWIDAHERHVRRALARISASHRRTAVSRPPMVLPGGSAPDGASPADPSAGVADSEDLPVRLWFGPPTPNPSPGEVRFRVDLPVAAVVRMTVLDVAGRLVGEAGGPHPAGRHVVTWRAGDRLARSGVFFARLEVNGRTIGTRRLVVLR